jgi:hypothetical protein
MKNSDCVILVPANGPIELACESALRQLESLGYPVWRIHGFAAIDQGRCQIATDAIANGFRELMWIDSDMDFHPNAVEHLRSCNLPIVSAIYAKKGVRALASDLLPTSDPITFGEGGGIIEIRYAAAGFLFTRSEVYLEIQRRLALPTCNRQFGKPLVPYFMPMVVPEENQPLGNAEHRYLSEDFAFCHRARSAGFKTFADTTLRVGHVGRYVYGWEDAGISPQRFSTFHFHLANDAAE